MTLRHLPLGILFLSGSILTACGGEETTSNEANEGTSSIVATTDPEEVETNNDRFEQAAKSYTSNDVEESDELTEIKYLETKHEFGNVFFPSDNLYTFKFQNVGKNPLIIYDATASCGCTVPDPPKEPIAPGQYGELDVIFRPKKGQIGQPVTKRITVTANTDPKETYLEISASVIDAM
ncbi:MAG: DUF1573 domain-containing protein [Flavobacteriales bacterium]|jgi:hypothetical protein|nr:DUF1573 domain-containing protein [Flavobacteriales bacterium]